MMTAHPVNPAVPLTFGHSGAKTVLKILRKYKIVSLHYKNGQAFSQQFANNSDPK